MPEIQDILLTTSQMTSLFEITRQGLSRWTERGMPKKARNQYSLRECLEWIKRNVWYVGLGKEDLASEKLKYQKARTRREELRVLQDEKNLVPRDEAVKWVSLLVSESKAAFMNFPRRMGPLLAPVFDEKECEQLLRVEIWAILRHLAEEGKKKAKANEKT